MSKPHAVCEVELLTTGPVRPVDRTLAATKIRALRELGHEPVPSAAVNLRLRDGAADTLDAIAEATMDLNGVPIRAHAAGRTMGEAIDESDDRLTRRLRRHRKRLEDRHHDQDPEPVQTHPGCARFDPDEREVVRHKTLAMFPMSAEEAADEMDLLDHGFYLYLDAGHGLDRVVYRNGDGGLHVAPSVDGEYLSDARPPISPAVLVLNHLPLEEAEVLLDEGTRRSCSSPSRVPTAARSSTGASTATMASSPRPSNRAGSGGRGGHEAKVT